MAEELELQPFVDRTAKLVWEAQQRQQFKPLASGADKPEVLWLLELCANKSRRPDALGALEELVARKVDAAARQREAVGRCARLVPDAELRPTAAQIKAGASPPTADEADRVREIRAAMRTPPYLFSPPVTTPGAPDRHPWDGLVGVKPSFTEVACGVGMFAACFHAAGADVQCLIEPRDSAMRLAKINVPSASRCLRSITEVDPADIGWTHGIGGGPECQPFSVAGMQLAWADSRAYTMIRTLHVAAVMQPWWVWIENVQAITTVKEGRVWRLIKGIAELAGFEVQLNKD